MKDDAKPNSKKVSRSKVSGSSGTSPDKEEQKVSILHPTIASERLLRVKIPNNAAGAKFLQDLEELLQTKDLPFYPVCTQAGTKAASSDRTGHTTSSLSLHLEQEGWPP